MHGGGSVTPYVDDWRGVQGLPYVCLYPIGDRCRYVRECTAFALMLMGLCYQRPLNSATELIVTKVDWIIGQIVVFARRRCVESACALASFLLV